MGTLPARGEYVIRVLFRLFLAFSQFYSDFHGAGEVSEHWQNPRPVKNITCMRSNEHLESRMYNKECMRLSDG